MGIFDILNKVMKNKFTGTVAGILAATETIHKQVKQEMEKAKKMAITLFITYTLFVLALTMLVVGLVFWLPDQFDVTLAGSFFITGIALLVVTGFFYLLRTRK